MWFESHLLETPKKVFLWRGSYDWQREGSEVLHGRCVRSLFLCMTSINIKIRSVWCHFKPTAVTWTLMETPKCKCLGCKSCKFSIKMITRDFTLNVTVQDRLCKKKESLMVVWCKFKNFMTLDNLYHSATFVIPNSYPCEKIFNPHLSTS